MINNNKCLTHIIKLCCIPSNMCVRDKVVHCIKRFILFFSSRAKGNAEAHYNVTLAPSGVLFIARLFELIICCFLELCAKELFRKPLMCLQGNASSKKTRYLDLTTWLYTNYAHTHGLALFGEPGLGLHFVESYRWVESVRTPKGNLCDPIQCLFCGKFPQEATDH